MSDTPRSDENPEFRDPTAPSDLPVDHPSPSDSTSDSPSGSPSNPPGESPADHTAPIDTSATQAVPPVPPAPPAAPATPGYGPPQGSVPQNPYAAPQAPPAASPQNPYGAPPPPSSPYAQNPYAPNPYGQGAYGQAPYGGPTAYAAAPSQLSGSTIALLIVAGLTTVSCGFGILGLIFAIMAAAKKDEPAESAKYTRWGWIAVVAGLVLAILLAVVFIGVIAVGGSSYDSGY